VNEDLSRAVAIFRSSPNSKDDEVYRRLVADGVEHHLAAHLIEFLPIAYCRLILAGSGARFSNTFRRKLPDGTYGTYLLSSEPVWDAAVTFAHSEADRNVPGRDLLAVAARSAEFHAANQLLQKGSKLENLSFTPPILIWPESGPD
jgi:hypothetical protein